MTADGIPKFKGTTDLETKPAKKEKKPKALEEQSIAASDEIGQPKNRQSVFLFKAPGIIDESNEIVNSLLEEIMSKVIKGDIEDNKKIKTLSQKGYFNFNFSSVTSDTVPPVFGATGNMFKFNFKLDPKSDSDSNSDSHSDSNSSSCNLSSDDESIEIVNSIVEEIISRIIKESNFKVELNSAPIIFGAKEDITSQKGYKFDAYSALPNSFNFGSNFPIAFAPVFDAKLQTASSDPTSDSESSSTSSDSSNDEANEVVNSLTEEIISKITKESKKFGLNENSVSQPGYQFDANSTLPTSFNFGSVTLDAIPPVFVAPGNIKKIETAISETASDSDSSSNSSSSSDTN